MSETRYDYIIVGAGSAGCVLANRLSASGRYRVLLLEAGDETHPLSAVPISYSLFIDHPRANWRYFSEPEEATAGRAIPVPRGRMLGGSSAINGLVFVRGQPLDYDTWAQLGNRGWSFDDLLPFFRRMESFEGGADDVRAADGPLHVSESPDDSPLYDALFVAGEQVGLKRNPDYNGRDQEGMCKTQTTIRNGRRMSAAHCYLKPARGRENLEVETGALVRRLLLDSGRCVGVEYSVNGRASEARAGREVVLAAGAINSPQLLELSGIGDPERLRAASVEVVHELPGVGENLRDHYAPRMVNRILQRGVTYSDRMQGLGKYWQGLRYLLTRKGFLSIPSAPMLAFLRTREELASPDVQVHLVPYAIQNIQKRQLMAEPGMTMTAYQLRPESTGSIHIRSSDPAEYPAIRFNFLSAELDRQTLVAAIRKMREILDAPAMAGFTGEEIKPGRAVDGDAAILEWIKASAETAYHPVGTCKMGQDPMAVVDHELRVHGIEGLRVADGSIMPTLVSGNTNGPCIMIGEKASEMILGSAT